MLTALGKIPLKRSKAPHSADEAAFSALKPSHTWQNNNAYFSQVSELFQVCAEGPKGFFCFISEGGNGVYSRITAEYQWQRENAFQPSLTISGIILKGVVHQKKSILSFTHPHVDMMLWTVFTLRFPIQLKTPFAAALKSNSLLHIKLAILRSVMRHTRTNSVLHH